MKKAKRYFVLLFSTIFIIISLSSCQDVLDDLKEISKSLEAITYSETSETTAGNKTGITTKSIQETSEKETVFVPRTQSTAKPKESISPVITQKNEIANTKTTEVSTIETTPESTDQNDTLLKAESFTREDIIANGPLYARRDQFDPQFIEDALEYFPEIAGGNEFDPSIPEVLNRWDTTIPIKIATFGEPTTDDFARLDLIIPAIETLTALDIQYVEAGSTDYNFEFHVTPLDKFEDIFEEHYVKDNWGLVVHWHDDDGYNYYARMAVSNDYPNREEMNHLIMEEFIQALGLPNDSYRYEDSLFQQNWTATQELMPIDWLLLEFVYRPELTTNMSVHECVEILREIYLD
ncbi:MAG: DUF2927 domain-containing protein [Clostridiaceae bacterium]|nr:DUF2927 domain-containing protein [Clostridiaceae bacterium]